MAAEEEEEEEEGGETPDGDLKGVSEGGKRWFCNGLLRFCLASTYGEHIPTSLG